MNWRDKYAKIHSIDQLKIGDFISWRGHGKGRRYTIITDMDKQCTIDKQDGYVSGYFNENRELALKGQSSEITNRTTELNISPNNDIKIESR